MEEGRGTPEAKRRDLGDWFSPLRLYDPRVPAGRFVFLWGLVIFPLVVIFLLLTPIIIVLESASPQVNSDYLGIVVYLFMLAWLAATVAITRRRLLQLGRSQRWVWVVIFPIINLMLFAYLLLQSDPVQHDKAAN